MNPNPNCLNHLKPSQKKDLAQGQGGDEFQPADILKYFEDLKLYPNAEIGPIGFFEIASSVMFYKQVQKIKPLLGASLVAQRAGIFYQKFVGQDTSVVSQMYLT